MGAAAKNITIKAANEPAEQVFQSIIAQTGMNFVYTAGMLDGMKVSLDVRDMPLRDVLRSVFEGSAVTYRIKGRNVILSRRQSARALTSISGYVRESGTGEALIGAIVADSLSGVATTTNAAGFYSLRVPVSGARLTASYPGFREQTACPGTGNTDFSLTELPLESDPRQLDELVVTAHRNTILAHESTDVGRTILTSADIKSTPVIFGEADVIKTLQHQPGVSAGTEGMAGMYVHGGNHDENLYMLDNIPLYQVNHFGGLFSAFNTEAVKNVDFYKSTFPAKYDGRLSSIVEVHTKEGGREGHHGSIKLGLTSGAFNIDGPLFGGKTSYSLAVRRSWFDLLTIPALALYNNKIREDKENTTIARYDFIDVNAKITHRFSERSSVHGMFYYGDDYLKGGSKTDYVSKDENATEHSSDIIDMRWGNLVGALGWNYQFSPTVFGEFTAAYTHYRSKMHRDTRESLETADDSGYDSRRDYTTRNAIRDVTVRADLGWNPGAGHRVIFGANYTYHTFEPQKDEIFMKNMGQTVGNARSTQPDIHAGETALYAGDDWTLNRWIRLSYGVNAGLFSVDGRKNWVVDPRLALRWKLNETWSFKAAYSRMSQYVHQLTESSISLPTDRWIPISGDFGPQRSDKIAAAAYFSFGQGRWEASVEGYYKWMHNVVDYTDDYSMRPPDDWLGKLCAGKGWSKGVDMMVARRAGKITGHIAYSLLWADRQFADKNGGRPFPARFDNRHKINILASWRINKKWEVSAAWTGMSGNRITLYDQCYEPLPNPDGPPLYDDITYSGSLNNYRLPFYHRLDLSVNRYTRHGFWNISLFNAYSYMNAISVTRDYKWHDAPDGTTETVPTFKIYRMLPIIPSFSYTWIF